MRDFTSHGDVAQLSLLFVLVLTLANALFNVVAFQLGWPQPYTIFLARPDDNFADFFELLASYPGGAAAHVRHGPGLHLILPLDPLDHSKLDAGGLTPLTNLHMPPLSTVIALLTVQALRFVDAVTLFLLLCAGLLAYWIQIVRRFARTRGERLAWIALGAIAYPTLMTLSRGNLFAGLTGLLLIHALLLGLRRQSPIFVAILLALAVNIRPNAILFGGPLLLFYWQTRWRFGIALTIAGFAIAGLTLLAAIHFYPGYSLASFRSALAAYYRLYVIGFWGLAYGSSLFGALKILIGYRPGLDGATMLVALVIALWGLLARALGRLGDAAILFITAAAYVLGSNVIGDYHLGVFLIVPIAIALQPKAGPQDRVLILVSCLMLAPKNYGFIQPIWLSASLQIMLNPLFLLATALTVLMTREQAVPVLRFKASPAA